MNRKSYHSKGESGTAVGADVGATLAKLAVQRGGAPPAFALVPADPPEAVARAVAAERPERVGLTGPGASAVASHLPWRPARVDEFTAWGAGGRELLAGHGLGPGSRYLLVSVGTGTSVLLVDGERVTRVGGTALGGGTILGLGAALVGTACFEELCALAERGAREAVDLLVSDIYPPDEVPLPGALSASAFAKLAPRREAAGPPRREDLARALMALVGENVGLICGGLAALCGVESVVFGGSTLRDNAALVDLLERVVQAYGRKPTFLANGEFAGAVGALRHAQR